MTVVVAYLPTELGAATIRAGATQAQHRGQDLLVLNAASGAAYADSALATEAQLEAIRGELAAQGVTAEIRQLPRAASAAEAILEQAEAASATLLVIGLRPRSPMGKFLLGSTAQTLMLRSPCDVLAVKPQS
jgi:nucleotide-binding universal stress UspA family protein